MFCDGVSDPIDFQDGRDAAAIVVGHNEESFTSDPDCDGLKVEVFCVFVVLEKTG